MDRYSNITAMPAMTPKGAIMMGMMMELRSRMVRV